MLWFKPPQESSLLTDYGGRNRRRMARRSGETWGGLGHEVCLQTDFLLFAENLGAVHCITKYLFQEN